MESSYTAREEDRLNQNNRGELSSYSNRLNNSEAPVVHPSSPKSYGFYSSCCISKSPPATVIAAGGVHLIAPKSQFARAIVMGNEVSSSQQPLRSDSIQENIIVHGCRSPRSSKKNSPASNLTVLLNQQRENNTPPSSNRNNGTNNSPSRRAVDEADSASGPPLLPLPMTLGRSAPSPLHTGAVPPVEVVRQHSAGHALCLAAKATNASTALSTSADRVRRCLSSKEIGTIAPPSGSPYAFMLYKKEELEISMRKRLLALRETESANAANLQHSHAATDAQQRHCETEGSSSTSSRARKETANEQRNRRRAQHAQAVVDDLCEVVADLFVAESKLLNFSNYGVPQSDQVEAITTASGRDQMIKTARNFVSSLPSRYALGADTPSEVLLHMRLMAAARLDRTKAAVHIHNLEDDSNWSLTVAAASERKNHLLRLVTISCQDVTGLLEYITKLLASSGSRVLDADVMLSTDGIALDRFVVEMTGRLRLDRFADLIEDFLKGSTSKGDDSKSGSTISSKSAKMSPSNSPCLAKNVAGPLYYNDIGAHNSRSNLMKTHEQEIISAVPLSEVLASASQSSLSGPALPKLRRLHSMPTTFGERRRESNAVPKYNLPMRKESETQTEAYVPPPPAPPIEEQPQSGEVLTTRQRRPLENRRGSSDLDRANDNISDDGTASIDFLTVPSVDSPGGVRIERKRTVPLIPFDELMLIETIGTGRVSTIYRAAWQRTRRENNRNVSESGGRVQMVALKVAMVNTMTGDTSHVDELRREADIAARLHHPNICDLAGVAADAECFCLAYDYCEGGSLLSLLSDATRYYEYLPIALDIANGMAYLHSRNIIHRDLKPSNILLTRDHRAKIADFGMSVNNHGQELTAETGTYRYMAPEVIRHESYSSNADVYSFGICLWQLITREVPFATMTPIQAAYAVAEGHRPAIPATTPRRLQEIILSCWEHDSQRRPSFTYVAMALADYAKMAFSPANVGALTLQIANEMLATVEGNSTVNVDFTTPVSAISAAATNAPSQYVNLNFSRNDISFGRNDSSSNVGLEIE